MGRVYSGAIPPATRSVYFVPTSLFAMVELAGARFLAALSQSPPLTPIPRLDSQPWGLDTC